MAETNFTKKKKSSLLIGSILSIFIFLLSKIEILIDTECYSINNLWCSYMISGIFLISSIFYINSNNIKFKGGFLSFGLIYSFIAYIFLVLMTHEHKDIYPLYKENIYLFLFINIITLSIHLIQSRKIKPVVFIGMSVSTMVLAFMILEHIGCDIFYISTVRYIAIFVSINFITTFIYSLFLLKNGIFANNYLSNKEKKIIIVSLLLSSIGSLYFILVPTNKYILSKNNNSMNLNNNIESSNNTCYEKTNEHKNIVTTIAETHDTIENETKITSNRQIETNSQTETSINIKHLVIIVLSFIYAIILTPILFIGTAISCTGTSIASLEIMLTSGLLTCLSIILTPFSIIKGLNKNNEKYYLQYPLLAFVFIFIPFGGIILFSIIVLLYIKSKFKH